jgi:hypothetical protein
MRKASIGAYFLATSFAALVVGGCGTDEGGPGGKGAGQAPDSSAAATAGAESPSQGGPAQRAVAEIDAAMARVGLDAEKYAPGRLDGVLSDLEALKGALARHEDEAVLKAAPALLARVRALPAETEAAKKAALKRDPAAMHEEWRELSRTLPSTLGAIESRINALSRAAEMPQGITAEGLASARAGVAEARALLARATAAEVAGNEAQAVDLAVQAEGKVHDVLPFIGMSGVQ